MSNVAYMTLYPQRSVDSTRPLMAFSPNWLKNLSLVTQRRPSNGPVGPQ